MGEALMIAENGLGLKQEGSRHLLDDTISTVIGERLCPKGAGKEEEQLRTGIIGDCNGLSSRDFLEAELGMACHLSQIITAHPLEQRKLQELIV